MARTKREFVESGEVRSVAEKLKAQYPEHFEDLDLTEVYFAFCISTMPKNAKSPVIRKGISAPLPGMVARYPYQIAVYRDAWNDWTDAMRHLAIMNALLYIDEDGKYHSDDVKGLFKMIATFGPDWMEDPSIPDVLEDHIELRTRELIEDDRETDERQAQDPVVNDIVEEQERERQAKADAAANKTSETDEDGPKW